jgi:hypothetical protein
MCTAYTGWHCRLTFNVIIIITFLVLLCTCFSVEFQSVEFFGTRTMCHLFFTYIYCFLVICTHSLMFFFNKFFLLTVAWKRLLFSIKAASYILNFFRFLVSFVYSIHTYFCVMCNKLLLLIISGLHSPDFSQLHTTGSSNYNNYNSSSYNDNYNASTHNYNNPSTHNYNNPSTHNYNHPSTQYYNNQSTHDYNYNPSSNHYNICSCKPRNPSQWMPGRFRRPPAVAS